MRRERERERNDDRDSDNHRRRKRRHSPSSSESEASSSSDSSSDESRKSYRKHRKVRREKKRRIKEEKRKDEKKKKRKEKLERQKTGPVTSSWGKYGLIKEVDMWTKRPEFIAWLAEVKKVNMETLPSWEEKQLFKEYMEDYNTATFPSKKYYNLDKYHRQKMVKKTEKGLQAAAERTVFNDEEQRRLEMKVHRESQKEAEIDVLRQSMMGTGMAQAMKEQAQLREEMQYQYRIGNVEAANAIQRRLGPSLVEEE